MNRLGIVCFLVSTVAVSALRAQRTTIDVGMAAYQIGSPAAITYVQAAKDFPFKTVRLKNLTDRPISALKLAIILKPINELSPLRLERVLIKGSVVGLRMMAGTSEDIDDGSVYFPAFLEGTRYIRVSHLDANIGVLSVRFSDGAEWNSEAEHSLLFPIPKNTGQPKPCQVKPVLLASTNPQIIPAALQCDTDRTQPTDCELFGGVCSVTPCGCAPHGCTCGQGECPCTKCQWHN